MAADFGFADIASRTERKEAELVLLTAAVVHLEVTGIVASVQAGIVEVKASFGIGERGADHSIV